MSGYTGFIPGLLLVCPCSDALTVAVPPAGFNYRDVWRQRVLRENQAAENFTVELRDTSGNARAAVHLGNRRVRIRGLGRGEFVISIRVSGYQTIEETEDLNFTSVHGLTFYLKSSPPNAACPSPAISPHTSLAMPAKGPGLDGMRARKPSMRRRTRPRPSRTLSKLPRSRRITMKRTTRREWRKLHWASATTRRRVFAKRSS